MDQNCYGMFLGSSDDRDTRTTRTSTYSYRTSLYQWNDSFSTNSHNTHELKNRIFAIVPTSTIVGVVVQQHPQRSSSFSPSPAGNFSNDPFKNFAKSDKPQQLPPHSTHLPRPPCKPTTNKSNRSSPFPANKSNKCTTLTVYDWPSTFVPK